MIGLALLILCSFQVVGGFVIDRLFNPNRTSIPWWDKAHWWMGRLTVVAALVNIPLGIVLYSKTSTVSMSMVWFVSYGLLLGGAVISFIVLQCRMGQTHHHQHMQHVELKDDDDHSPSAAASTAAAAAGAYEAVSA